MHFALHALLCILVLTPIFELQAIPFTEMLLRANKKTLTTPKNSTTSNQTSTNRALGLALSLALAASYTHAQETQQKDTPQEKPPFSLKELNLKNRESVIEALQKAPDSEKELLAEKLAQHIAWYARDVSLYTIEDISTFLQHTTQKPHRILITALSKNITRFTLADITHILKTDNQEETHAFIAQALKDNYIALTSYSFFGVQLSSNYQWRREYAALLKALKPEHQGKVLQPILADIENYNVFVLLYYAHTEHRETILNALQKTPAINLSVYHGCELHHLLELTKNYNQTMVAQAIADTIDTYNGWHFHGMFKLCTEESKKIILGAIAKHLNKNIDIYDTTTLSIIQEMAHELPQDATSIYIAKTIQAKKSALQNKPSSKKNNSSL